MIFRQFFDPTSSTYSYVLASGVRRETIIIDPVRDQMDQYLKVIEGLDLKAPSA